MSGAVLEVGRLQRFRIDGPLGRGGMAAVYRGYDPQLERSVAIKVMSAPARDLADAVDDRRTLDLRQPSGVATGDDLLREARVMAKLSHPNILPVYEVGLDDRRVFLVMELIEGRDLREWLSAAPRALADIVAVFVQAAHGIAAAHAAGVVHRDLKPENILVGDDGRVRVADFGIAALIERPRAGAMARVGDDRGTPEYMAPELWCGEPATPRSDVYAFAITLAEAILGERPGDDADARDRALVARGASQPVRDAIRDGLADDPRQRPPDGAAVAARLTARSSRRAWWLAGGTAMAALVIAGGVIAVAGDDDPPSCTPDPARLVGRWDPARRAALAPDVAAFFDSRIAIETSLRERACRDRADGTISAAEHDRRIACLDRRLIEIGVRADRKSTRDDTTGMPLVETCTAIEGRPLDRDPEARKRVADLYDRQAATRRKRDDDIAAHSAIETAAIELGDVELAARAAIELARAQGWGDIAADLALADSILERAHRHATTARSDDLVALSLTERARLALRRYDMGVARAMAALAVDLDAAPMRPRTRVRIHATAGRVARTRGDRGEAVRHLERALALAGELAMPSPSVVVDIRVDLIDALDELGGRDAEVRAMAIATVDIAREQVGEKSHQYRAALERATDVHRGVDPAIEQKYELAYREALRVVEPANPKAALQYRAALVIRQMFDGDYHRALAFFEDALEQARRDPTLAEDRFKYVAAMGAAYAGLGRYVDGRKLLDDVVVDMAARYGRDSPATAGLVYVLLGFDIELDDFDRADRRIAELERAYATWSDPTARERAKLAGPKASLALRRGRTADAERLVREGMAALDELGDPIDSRTTLLTVRGRIHLARSEWKEARAIFADVLATIRKRSQLPATIAEQEFLLARAEHGDGATAAAIERARDALRLLDRYPDHVKLRGEIAAWLATRRDGK